MRPLTALSAADLDTWGDDEIKRLSDHFDKEKTHQYTIMEDGQKVKKVSTSQALLSAKDTKAEWNALKKTVVAQ
jgi:hypothetical protein